MNHEISFSFPLLLSLILSIPNPSSLLPMTTMVLNLELSELRIIQSESWLCASLGHTEGFLLCLAPVLPEMGTDIKGLNMTSFRNRDP